MIVSSLKAVFLVLFSQDESFLGVSADHFDGLDVKETVTELFEEVIRSESSNEVGETSKKVGLSPCGIEIVTQEEVEERKGERIPQNARKSTAWHTRVWDEWALISGHVTYIHKKYLLLTTKSFDTYLLR